MATGRYLAIRSAEFDQNPVLPPKCGWMVSPFSPEWMCPPDLSPGSLLILTDEQIPVNADWEQILQSVRAMGCAGVVLDFQKPKTGDTAAFAARLAQDLPCPVAVSEAYAASLPCPVFLSPCPHHVPLQEHLASWAGREIWLDLAVDAEIITLTAEGAVIAPVVPEESPPLCHREERLHCHYSIETGEDFARFTLWRTKEDVDNLQLAAEALGVHTFVGLRQELGEAWSVELGT